SSSACSGWSAGAISSGSASPPRPRSIRIASPRWSRTRPARSSPPTACSKSPSPSPARPPCSMPPPACWIKSALEPPGLSRGGGLLLLRRGGELGGGLHAGAGFGQNAEFAVDGADGVAHGGELGREPGGAGEAAAAHQQQRARRAD